MLSRLSVCGGQNLRQCVLKFQPAFLTTSAGSTSDKVVKKDIVNPPPGHPPEFPPPTSKRDFVNFPKTFILRETTPPVRFGFIPDSWFQFMYPKTGYTGPYAFMATVLTYLLSKEILVIEHGVLHTIGFILFCCLIRYKFGDIIAELYNKKLKEEEDLLNGLQDERMIAAKEQLALLKSFDKMKSAVAEVAKARTELIILQLENAYRERVMDVFNQVKSKLDCQAELENIERRMYLKNVVDYVLKNVMSSITPDLEKNVLQTCISDLSALAAKP